MPGLNGSNGQEPEGERELPAQGGLLAEIEQAILQMSWLGQRQFMQLLEDDRFRLTLPQFYTLLSLAQIGGACKMSDLADATCQSAASLTGVVERLLGKQLVVRVRDERDRRQVMVVLTPQGRALVAEIRQVRQRQMRRALAHLSPDDIAALQRLLDGTLQGMLRLSW